MASTAPLSVPRDPIALPVPSVRPLRVVPTAPPAPAAPVSEPSEPAVRFRRLVVFTGKLP
jgi:hypothetical protein